MKLVDFRHLRVWILNPETGKPKLLNPMLHLDPQHMGNPGLLTCFFGLWTMILPTFGLGTP